MDPADLLLDISFNQPGGDDDRTAAVLWLAPPVVAHPDAEGLSAPDAVGPFVATPSTP